ncbi:hypothetical protein ACN28E_38725 [Archangium lansingense]|uniref:hypothetical protein n=1 Tax=Archangium lansingense TaxID=2995310 RepID=UPI003B79F1F7
MDALRAMDGLLEYCERLAPGFLRTIRGASEADLARLESLSGQALPAEYRAFLARMGRSAPKSLAPFFSDVEFGIEVAERFYLEPPIPVPPDAVFLWTLDRDCDMFLPTTAEWAPPLPVLLFHWPIDEVSGGFLAHDRQVTVISRSLMTFLYREAFQRLRSPSLAHRLDLRENAGPDERTELRAAERKERFRSLAAELGFRPLPFLDPDILHYDREDAALSLFSRVLAEDSLSVYADDVREAGRLAEILCERLDVRRLR